MDSSGVDKGNPNVAHVDSVITTTERASALCPHFGECGGCESQDVAYEEQLRAKQSRLAELFAPYWEAEIPITPSPEVWNYRNKVDFNFARKLYEEPPPEGFVLDQAGTTPDQERTRVSTL